MYSGDFMCLCGKNGSGKSTLLSILAGLPDKDLKNISGDIKINDKSLKSFSTKEKAKIIAYMQQNEFSTWDFSVFDFVLQGRFAYSKNGWYSDDDKKIVTDCLNSLELSNLSSRKIQSLSGGEFQKVRIARALAQQPQFMLLDEPSANLDFVYEPKLLELLKQIAKENQIGILLTIHDINLAAIYAEKMAFLSSDGIIYGKTEEVFIEENLSKAFNTELHTYVHQIYNKLQVTNEGKN